MEPMPTESLAHFLLLPELKLLKVTRDNRFQSRYLVEKTSEFEVCPKCGRKSSSIYDRRIAVVKDSPIRGVGVRLEIQKRRFSCAPCKKPFTEYVQGISPGKRTTERYRRAVTWACENFSDLKRVKRAFHCSSSLIYKIFYEVLEKKRKEQLNYSWPSVIGVDEHSFRRNRRLGVTEFVSLFVDYKNKRPMELVEGKTAECLYSGLHTIPGRENVRWAVTDLADSYKSFLKDFFPKVELVADKFHVLRLLHGAINKRRKEITGDKRTNPIRRLLLRSRAKLEPFQRRAIDAWLTEHPELQEIYHYKEALHALYRWRGYNRATRVLTSITDRMANSAIAEIKTLRRTLLKWRHEILNYFQTGLTNGRTEGFNNVCKVIKRRAYGYKSFANYRLRVLTAAV
jgi:transposase